MRDTITIGTSAGGVEALQRVLAPLDPGIAASVLVVQHLSPAHDPYLVEILRRATRLSVAWAEQGAAIAHGAVYVAPPDQHLTIEDDHVRLDGGPRENHARPSIDRLFRSAAASRGSRTIGVLMTGMLHDGVAGLREIQLARGFVIVQNPAHAQFPELPSQALRKVEPDRLLDLQEIGPELARLCSRSE